LTILFFFSARAGRGELIRGSNRQANLARETFAAY